jgi:peptidoglycan/xylan/chitin deacetylase (PgdA/CDA1 family)
MLSWSQLENAARSGMEIGAHTRSHPDLTRVSAQTAEDEIRASRTEIEDRLGREVVSFAYPYGLFDVRSCDLVRRHFRVACTTVLGRATREPLHLLPRVDVYYLRSDAAFERAITGQLDTYLALRRLGRTVRSALSP